MKDVMIDLETLGLGVDSVFISIGAVYFDRGTGELGDQFYMNIDWQSSLDEGRKVDASTIQWWFQQSEEARAAVLTGGKTLIAALLNFSKFIAEGVCVWGNGSSFDISMLEHTYRAAGIDIPWSYRNVRDVRTIVDLGRQLIDWDTLKLEGTAHNALDDAKYQAQFSAKIISHITEALK